MPKDTKKSIHVHVGGSTTAKRDEVGYSNLLRFCACANSLLSVSDSLNYAQVLGTLEKNEEVSKRIDEIRMEVLEFVDKQIEKACSGNGPIVKEMVFQAIMSQVPAMFQYYNVKALSDLRVDSRHPDAKF